MRRAACSLLSGHSASGFRNVPYLTVILNLVRKGFVVFGLDSVGRGEPTLEHSYPGAQCSITGSLLAAWFER